MGQSQSENPNSSDYFLTFTSEKPDYKVLPIPSEKLEKLVPLPGIEPGSPANVASALTTELPNRAR